MQLTLKTPPAASDDPLLPLKNVRILLDAGHGGTDPGALGVGGEGVPQEKDLNLMAAQGAQQRLEQLGAEVIMLRSDDTFFSLDERLLKISEVQPDFFLSLHHNSTVNHRLQRLVRHGMLLLLPVRRKLCQSADR